MQNEADIIIAGGGPSGVLTAARLAAEAPKRRILILEKDSGLGGRLRPSDAGKHWGYGLNLIGAELFGFWDQTLRQNPEAQDLAYFVSGQTREFGVLHANAIEKVATEALLSPAGFKAIAGPAAGRDFGKWEAFVTKYQREAKAEAFGHIFAGDRQAAATIALGHLARAVGITDLSHAAAGAVFSRLEQFTAVQYFGRWDEALAATLAPYQNVQIAYGARVMRAQHSAGHWHLSTALGSVQAPALVVAHTPWDAAQWLPKDSIPTPVLGLLNHVQPVSVITLSMRVLEPLVIPELLLVPAEDVQVFATAAHELCCQAVLDFELTFEAPAVVKAIRRLRRARRRLESIFGAALFTDEHLSLLPAAWAPPVGQAAQRYVERLRKADYQKRELSFVGDCYGPAYVGDSNLVSSILHTVAVLNEPKPAERSAR